MPTPIPTPTPTALPINAPTSLPTPIPTLNPTSVPTPLPTVVPTPSPSLTPSVAPTVLCSSGTYIDGLSCVDCPIGQYSVITGLPFPETCTLCKAGKYNTKTGSDECAECGTGKLSSDDRSYCKDCLAGEYNFNNTECVECESGKYAPQALSGQCLDCVAGFQTNNITRATTCTQCDAGSYSNASTVSCSLCPVGSYSFSGASRCVDCSAYFYSDEVGSSSCAHCDLGYYSPVGSSACGFADSGYYLAYPNGKSVACPSNAQCFGLKSMPVPNDGFWVDRGNYKYAGELFKCARATCLVQAINSSSCWDKSQFSNQSELCHSDFLECVEGSGGPLCGTCLRGYVFASVTNDCKKCGVARTQSYVVMGGMLLVAVSVLLYLQYGNLVHAQDNVIVKYIVNLDSGTLKVFIPISMYI